MNRRNSLSAIAAALALGALGLPQAAAAADVTLTYAFFAPAKTFPAVQMAHWAQQQHTIRIAMRHSRHGCIFVFAEWVCHIHVCDVAFLNPGDGLFADRVVGVVGVYQ